MHATPDRTGNRRDRASDHNGSRFVSFVVTALVVIAMSTACSSAPQAEYSPDQATGAVQRTLGPSAAQLDCLRAKFKEQPEIATIFNVGDKASPEQRDAYLRAIRTCIPVEDFASLLAASIEAADPSATADPAGTSPTAVADATSDCVRGAVVGLSAAEQDRLYLYFSNPASVNALEIAPTTKAISDACGLAAPNYAPPP